jgi:hypothetical protein
MPTTSTQVNTGKVMGRRNLRFNSPADMEVDVAGLVTAQRAGRLTPLGNWTLGQALNHLGSWVAFGFDGNPLRPPWFVKLIVGRMKNTYVHKGMPAGVHIPRVPGGTAACEACGLDEGLANFNAAWGRLKKDAPTLPNPVFGPLTHEEWIQLHLRHAELHLSFFKAE